MYMYMSELHVLLLYIHTYTWREVSHLVAMTMPAVLYKEMMMKFLSGHEKP